MNLNSAAALGADYSNNATNVPDTASLTQEIAHDLRVWNGATERLNGSLIALRGRLLGHDAPANTIGSTSKGEISPGHFAFSYRQDSITLSAMLRDCERLVDDLSSRL